MVFTVALPFSVLIRLFSAFGIQIGCVASLLICLCEAQNAPLTTLAAHRRQLRQGKANLFKKHNSYTRQFKVLYSYIKSEEGK